MKKSFILLVAVVFTCSASFARIWRVNNNTGITADFTSIQQAHDGAASGDTLYLESSPTSYGGLNSNKKLSIIGTGYFLGQNQGLQAFVLPSQVGTITLTAGSDGSIIEGLSFNGSSVNIYVSNIIIRRNHFGTFNVADPEWSTGIVGIYAAVANVFITQNCAFYIDNNSASTGILISNNFVGYGHAYGDATSTNCINLHQNTVAIIKNNIFRRGTVTAYNSNISNNIMYNGFFAGTGNLVSNNIASGDQFGTADGNKANVDMTTVFAATGSFDSSFKLRPGSPAIGAGYGSTAQNPIDAGMYGGSTPYVLSGLPAIPSIYFFANQPVGSNSDPIDVQIKVRSNN